jgi:hypothetical protein
MTAESIKFVEPSDELATPNNEARVVNELKITGESTSKSVPA